MKFAAAALCLALAACGTTYAVPEAGGPAVAGAGPGRQPAEPRRLRPRRRPGRARRRGVLPRGRPGRARGLLRLPRQPRDRPADAAERVPDPRPRRPPGGGDERDPAARDALRRRDRLRPVARGRPPHRRPHPQAAAAADARRPRPRRHRRRRRQPLRRSRLRRGDPAGDGRRRLCRRPLLFADLRARGRHPRLLHRRDAPATRPSAAPTSSAARRSPTPAARRSSPRTRPPASARPPSPASPPTSAASRRSASPPRAPAPPAEKSSQAAILGVASHRPTSLDTPSPRRTGPTGSQRGGENRATRCGTRQSNDATLPVVRAL